MIRQIIIPRERTYTLEMPESFVGKQVEILVFEVNQDEEEKKPKKDSFAERTKDLRYSSGGYKFNRLEANEYD
jgi:spore coat polysaccharide biosynthesis protein SpsF (cytidylyltransferase family)